MVRVISQETYNETVKQNKEDFSLSVEEAIEETIKEFEAQGVDLSNIIKDLSLFDESDPLLSCLDELSACLENKKYESTPILLEKLKVELDKDIARRVYTGKNGGYKILLDLLTHCQNDDLIFHPALETMTSLMTGNPDLLDDAGVVLQMQLLDSCNDTVALQYLLQWMKECCLKHENNRQRIFKAGVFDKLKKLLVRESTTGSELRHICGVLRALVLDDDLRHAFGKAHEHASTIARGSLNIITNLLSKFRKDKSVVGDLMLTLAVLIVRHEFCQDVEDAGGLKFLLDVMTDFPDSEKLNCQALKLLKALAGNDDVKAHIITSGSAPLIISLIYRFKHCESLVTAALACISALTLRSSANSGVFYDCGSPPIIIDAMKAFPRSASVLRQASWVIRNMSVRNQMESREFIQYGAEEQLKNGLKMGVPDLENDIKAALRDLGLKVDLKERWTGKGGALSH